MESTQMGNLAQLAATIEDGIQHVAKDDIDPALARRNAATADAIRAAGIPDALNRFLPENAHLNRRPEPMKTPGPKEAQLRALKETAATVPTAMQQPTAASAVATPEPTADAPAKPKKERAMRKSSATTKSKARTAVKAAATKAAKPGEKTKVELIADLLRRKSGCTTKDVLAACNWPAVSMPQQAKAAGIKLRKVKEGKITRYFAA